MAIGHGVLIRRGGSLIGAVLEACGSKEAADTVRAAATVTSAAVDPIGTAISVAVRHATGGHDADGDGVEVDV